MYIFVQVKPPNWTPHSAQQIDTWLYNQITHTVVARAKSLDREQLRLYLSETLLKKSTLPADIQTIRHVIDAMYTDYFQCVYCISLHTLLMIFSAGTTRIQLTS